MQFYTHLFEDLKDLSPMLGYLLGLLLFVVSVFAVCSVGGVLYFGWRMSAYVRGFVCVGASFGVADSSLGFRCLRWWLFAFLLLFVVLFVLR